MITGFSFETGLKSGLTIDSITIEREGTTEYSAGEALSSVTKLIGLEPGLIMDSSTAERGITTEPPELGICATAEEGGVLTFGKACLPLLFFTS